MNTVTSLIAVLLVVLSLSFAIVRNAYATPPIMYMIGVNKDGFHHGDAYLLKANDQTAMIDVANYDSAKALMIPFLRAKQINTINKLFITHPHTDHYGGIMAIVEANIHVDTLYHNPLPNHISDWNYKPEEYQAAIKLLTDNGTNIVDISRGDIIDFGKTQFDVIYAEKADNYEGRSIIVNDYSPLITWQVNGSRVLFTGDMEETGAVRLPEYLDIRADIVHMQHHGGYNVGNLDFYREVNASLHLYSSTNQIYTLISGSARSITRTLNSNYCHSGKHGTVKISFHSNNFEVESESGGCSQTVLAKKFGELEHQNPAISGHRISALPAIISVLLNE